MHDDIVRAKDHVGSLERGLAVLEILARNPEGMTLTEVAAEGGMTRASARRFLLTLVNTGYATQTGRAFRLSPRILSVARTWLGASTLWTVALPVMREVAAAFNEACSAAVLDGGDVVYMARVPGGRILSVELAVGTRLPAYCTSMGHVLLAVLPPADLESVLKTTVLAARTDRTITDKRQLAEVLEKVRLDGFAIADEQLELGLRSIAVPIRHRDGGILAALNVSTQTARLSVAELRETVLPRLRAAAQAIAAYGDLA